MEILKDNYYKIQLSTSSIDSDELNTILTKLTKKFKKEYSEVDLYDMLNVIEMEEITTEFERGLIFYFFISTFDDLCISSEDTKEIYDSETAIEITINDLRNTIKD